MHIASEIEVPAASLIRESVGEDAQKVIELAEDVQELVAEKDDELLKSTVENQKEEGISEVAASKPTRGNSASHNISDSITNLDTSSPSSSSETSSIPSPSNQTSDKPDDVYVPMYPSVKERIDEMIHKTLDVSQRLPENH